MLLKLYKEFLIALKQNDIFGALCTLKTDALHLFLKYKVHQKCKAAVTSETKIKLKSTE